MDVLLHAVCVSETKQGFSAETAPCLLVSNSVVPRACVSLKSDLGASFFFCVFAGMIWRETTNMATFREKPSRNILESWTQKGKIRAWFPMDVDIFRIIHVGIKREVPVLWGATSNFTGFSSIISVVSFRLSLQTIYKETIDVDFSLLSGESKTSSKESNSSISWLKNSNILKSHTLPWKERIWELSDIYLRD